MSSLTEEIISIGETLSAEMPAEVAGFACFRFAAQRARQPGIPGLGNGFHLRLLALRTV